MRVGSTNRWDALALTERLRDYRWYIVERDNAHWDVYVVFDDEDKVDVPEIRSGSRAG